jgi:hypothetical protein
MRLLRQVIFVLLAAGLIYLLGDAIAHISGPRVVARADVPSSVEFRVVQKCNWGGEPFTTSCYFRKPGGKWGWFYYDHEDNYWGSGTAQVDPVAKRISILREGKVTVTFDWETEVYQRIENGKMKHETTGAQSWMASGWEPPE